MTQASSCKKIPIIPETEDSEKIVETDQGLGETSTLNNDKTKLVVCAPRRKERYHGFCQMSGDDRRSRSNVRGRCYEFSVDKWNSSEVETHDNCKATEWRDVEEGEKVDTHTFSSMTSSTPEQFTCLQLDLHNWTSTEFPVQGTGITITSTGFDSEKFLNFTITTSQNSVGTQFQCGRQGLAFARLTPGGLRVYCDGDDTVSRIDVSRVANEMDMELKGPSTWWEEKFLNFTALRTRKEFLQNMDTCALGHSAWFDPDATLVLSAPGYKLKAMNSYKGTLFFGDVILDSDIMTHLDDIEEKGFVYRSIAKDDATWSAFTGTKTNPTGHCVIVLKDRKYHSKIDNEESKRDGFGRSLSFWSGGSILQLLVSAPYAPHDVKVDCGVLYVYKLEETTEQFQLHHAIRAPSGCGGFGATVVDVGDLDGDGFSDFAVGALYDNSVYIIRGRSDGIQSAVSQTIRPQETLKTFDNMFGFAISGHKELLAISDPIANEVYLYKTLDVVDMTTDLSECATDFNIDTQDSVMCKVCFELNFKNGSSSSLEVDMTLSWAVNNKNITEKSRKKSRVITLSGENCAELEFTRLKASDIKYFDLSSDLTINFTFLQSPDPAEGRIVAIAPETLEDKTHVINTNGKCGKTLCKADFVVAVESDIERRNQTRVFETIKNETSINEDELYFGSGNETLILNITVQANAGEFAEGKYGEQLELGFGGRFGVSVSKSSCNDIEKLNKISIDLTTEENCSIGAEACGDFVFSCEKLDSEGSEERKFLLRVPLTSDEEYSSENVLVNLTLVTTRSIEINETDNFARVSVPINKVLESEVTSTLKPANIEGLRLRNFRSSSKTLQGYGPDQTLTINLENRGRPTIDNMEVTLMYPVQYSGQEMIYVSGVIGSDNCTEDTERILNYRNLRNIYNSEEKESQEKFSSLPVVDCGYNWKCVRLSCSVLDIETRKNKDLIVMTYLNAEAASQYPNITYTLEYNVTLLDTRSVFTSQTVQEEMSSTVEVIPGIVGTLWYIVAGLGGGSLLLVILVLVLVRCGFFSRKERDELRLLRNAAQVAVAEPAGAYVESNQSDKMKLPDHVPEPPSADKT